MANRRIKIEIGQIFNRLTVLESIGKSKHGHLLYNCKCICGNIKAVTGASLQRKEVQSCGCLKSENTSKMAKDRRGTTHLEKGQAGKNHLYSQYKNGARKRNLEFDLTKDELIEISSKNCYYCAQPPSQFMNSDSDVGKYIYNGIDRLNSKLGYNKENCVPCCKNCNRAKSDMPLEDFYNWVKRLNKFIFKTRFNNE
jgi:hypothetical protein